MWKGSSSKSPSMQAPDIVGAGTFRKKGSRIRSWKLRTYEIHSDGQIVYSDPQTEEVKGTFDITTCELSTGPVENVEKSGLDRATAIPIIITSAVEKRGMEIVFDSLGDAKQFCMWVAKVSKANNVKTFASAMQWNEILPLMRPPPQDDSDTRREAESLYEAEPRYSIARGAISDEESDEDIQGGVPFTAGGTATVVREGVFVKRGQVRKTWKKRHYILKSNGILEYRSDKSSLAPKGYVNVRRATVVETMMNRGNGKEPLLVLEIDTGSTGLTGRVLTVTFDTTDMKQNAELADKFLKALVSVGCSESNITVVQDIEKPKHLIEIYLENEVLVYGLIIVWMLMLSYIWVAPGLFSIFVFCALSSVLGHHMSEKVSKKKKRR